MLGGQLTGSALKTRRCVCNGWSGCFVAVLSGKCFNGCRRRRCFAATTYPQLLLRQRLFRRLLGLQAVQRKAEHAEEGAGATKGGRAGREPLRHASRHALRRSRRDLSGGAPRPARRAQHRATSLSRTCIYFELRNTNCVPFRVITFAPCYTGLLMYAGTERGGRWREAEDRCSSNLQRLCAAPKRLQAWLCSPADWPTQRLPVLGLQLENCFAFVWTFSLSNCFVQFLSNVDWNNYFPVALEAIVYTPVASGGTSREPSLMTLAPFRNNNVTVQTQGFVAVDAAVLKECAARSWQVWLRECRRSLVCFAHRQ